MEPPTHQELVDAHFDAFSEHWRDLYGEQTLEGIIHGERRELTLAWIDELALPLGSRILDLGCGAGVLATDLAERGYTVQGVDTSERMLHLARERAVSRGVRDAVEFRSGDAHHLDFEPGLFQLVVALGVIPYLHTPLAAVGQMARVLEDEGFLLVSSDNRFRLSHILDPRRTPLLPGRQQLVRISRRLGRRTTGPPNRFLSYRTVERVLRAAGFSVQTSATIGYGPFTFLGRGLFSEQRGVRLHRRLQALANRQVPLLPATGAQHLILARKRTSTKSFV